MGSIQSNVTKQTLQDYTSQLNSSIVQNFNQSGADCNASNYARIVTGEGVLSNCTFEVDGKLNIGQNATVNCTLDNYNTTISGNSFQNFVQNNAQQFINQNAQTKNGFFATGFSLGVNKGVTADDIATAIANEVSTDAYNTCQSNFSSGNNAVIRLCGYFKGDIDITQDASTYGVTSCINRLVQTAFTSNQVLNTFWMSTDQALASENKGAASAILAVLIPIVIVIVALVVLLIVLFLIFEVARYFVTQLTGHDVEGEALGKAVDAGTSVAKTAAMVALV